VALSVGIFRHRSQRPFQRAIRQKFVVMPVYVAPPSAETPGVLARKNLEKQYSFYRQRKLPDVRWQIDRPRSFTKFVPSQTSPVAARKNLEKQYQFYRQRELPDVRWQINRPRHHGKFIAPDQEPGYLAAVKSLRKQLGRPRPVPDVRWQLQPPPPTTVYNPPAPGWLEALYRRKVQYPRLLEREVFDVRRALKLKITTGAVPLAVPEPGYLTAVKNQRKQLGWESERFDVRWQIHRRHGVFDVAPSGANIGWLVAYYINRAYSHNLRR
jgi:hypothetical protein